MTTTSTLLSSPTVPPNALFLQQEQTKKLQAELEACNQAYQAMSDHRNRVDISPKNFDDFIRRHKELFIESLHLQAELKRSKDKEEQLKRALTLVVEAGAA